MATIPQLLSIAYYNSVLNQYIISYNLNSVSIFYHRSFKEGINFSIKLKIDIK